MKKLIALLLVFVMVLTMVACAAKTNAPKADTPANDTKTDAPATDESKTEARYPVPDQRLSGVCVDAVPEVRARVRL